MTDNTEHSDETKSTSETLAKNGIKLVGERFLPGASLLMEGKIVEGGAHAVLGLTAKALFGLPGMIVLSANSYSRAVTGKSLLDHAREIIEDEPEGRDSKEESGQSDDDSF